MLATPALEVPVFLSATPPESTMPKQLALTEADLPLDGAEFSARIGIEKDGQGEYRNIIRLVIEPDHKAYAELIQAKLQRDGALVVVMVPVVPRQWPVPHRRHQPPARDLLHTSSWQ